MTEVEDFLERHADDIRDKLDFAQRMANLPWIERALLNITANVGLPERFVRQEPPKASVFVKRYQRMMHGVDIPARGRDFLDRHGDMIKVIVIEFGGKLPAQPGIVEFVAASQRCQRKYGRLMNDEEFNAALLAFEGDHALDER